MKWNKNAASQKGRVFRSGLLSTAMLAAVLVLAVLLNLLVRAIPAKYTEFDLSEAKMYTLSDSTKALVEGLKRMYTSITSVKPAARIPSSQSCWITTPPRAGI